MDAERCSSSFFLTNLGVIEMTEQKENLNPVEIFKQTLEELEKCDCARCKLIVAAADYAALLEFDLTETVCDCDNCESKRRDIIVFIAKLDEVGRTVGQVPCFGNQMKMMERAASILEEEIPF